MAAINNMLRQYGALDAVFGQAQYAQIPVAASGIIMKLFQSVICIVVGMAAGCVPMAGYNVGAEKKLRARAIFTKLLVAEALVGAVALLLVEGFPRQLIAIFGAANESVHYTDFAVKAFHDGLQAYTSGLSRAAEGARALAGTEADPEDGTGTTGSWSAKLAEGAPHSVQAWRSCGMAFPPWIGKRFRS